MKLQLLAPIDDLVQKVEEQRIDRVVRLPIGHEVQVDGQSDDIAAQALDVDQVLLRKLGELNLPGAADLQPARQIDPAMERDLGPAATSRPFPRPAAHTNHADQRQNRCNTPSHVRFSSSIPFR